MDRILDTAMLLGRTVVERPRDDGDLPTGELELVRAEENEYRDKLLKA
jgi:hypothetical protein